MNVAGRPIGPSKPCFIVGEVAQAHDGSLGTAHAYIDAIADAGADAVKFQTHIAAAESTPAEPWRIKFSPQDATRYDYWKRMEFNESQWIGLKQHADERGLIFLSTPFSVEAVQLLERVGMPAWKVASGEVDNPILLDAVAKSKQPVMVSSGMSSMEELDQAVAFFQEKGIPVAVFQCTTAYPCPPEKLGIQMIQRFSERYGCPVGLSDHSGSIYAGLAAATLGVNLLEVHVTFSRETFGPDVPASVTTKELRQVVEGVRFIERALSHSVSKDGLAEEMSGLRRMFGKSVVARIDLPVGTVLKADHLTVKKPGTGVPPSHLSNLIGRRLRSSVAIDQQLREDQLAIPQ
jgi:N,N'-diacetyllegionaminate synthase